MQFEYRGHLHIHTAYSDGAKLHADIAREAIAAGLDFLIITDHNLWVDGVEGYYGDEKTGRVLLLTGEEVHDVRRDPQGNHCLVFGAEKEMSPYAADPQGLMDAVNEAGGFCFLAHPFEVGSPLLGGDSLAPLNWENWEISGYAGLEIWNYMSEFVGHLTNKAAAIRAAYHPEQYITGPYSRTMEKWDQLLASGRRVSCIGGGDVHAGTYTLGPWKRQLFPYKFHFTTLNTHVATSKPLTGDFENDKSLILTALREGNSWVGYDAAGDTAGFHFSAQALKQQANMGEVLTPRRGHTTFQITVPRPAHIRLIHNGQVIAETVNQPHLLHQSEESGAFRVEAFCRYAGRKRGWIYSNPIYVRRRTASV